MAALHRGCVPARRGAGSAWTYSFSGWQQEDMGIPRVGGEAVLLPNGDVIQTGGCQVRALRVLSVLCTLTRPFT